VRTAFLDLRSTFRDAHLVPRGLLKSIISLMSLLLNFIAACVYTCIAEKHKDTCLTYRLNTFQLFSYKMLEGAF